MIGLKYSPYGCCGHQPRASIVLLADMLTFCTYAAFATLCEHALSANSTVHFDSRSPEFDRLVGRKPSCEYLATDKAEVLGAHEGAVFLEHGSQSDISAILSSSPCLIFTTKPQGKADDKVAQIKRIIIDGPRKGAVHTLFTSENLVNGATLGFDGRLYFCFQGGLETNASGIYRFIANPRARLELGKP